MRRAALAVLVAVTVAGCTENIDPVTPNPISSTLSVSSWSSGSSTLIVRSSGGDPFILLNDDPSVDLVAVMRTPTAPANLVPCGGDQDLDAAAVKLIFHGSGAVNLQIKGSNVHVWLYERQSFFSALFGGGLCAALATQGPLYEGFADFTLHDNDAFASGVHTDSFGFSSKGSVNRISDGAAFSYRNDYHGVLSSDGTVKQFSSTITLRAGK